MQNKQRLRLRARYPAAHSFRPGRLYIVPHYTSSVGRSVDALYDHECMNSDCLKQLEPATAKICATTLQLQAVGLF